MFLEAAPVFLFIAEIVTNRSVSHGFPVILIAETQHVQCIEADFSGLHGQD
jgi:hypothetical protein